MNQGQILQLIMQRRQANEEEAESEVQQDTAEANPSQSQFTNMNPAQLLHAALQKNAEKMKKFKEQIELQASSLAQVQAVVPQEPCSSSTQATYVGETQQYTIPEQAEQLR